MFSAFYFLPPSLVFEMWLRNDTSKVKENGEPHHGMKFYVVLWVITHLSAVCQG